MGKISTQRNYGINILIHYSQVYHGPVQFMTRNARILTISDPVGGH